MVTPCCTRFVWLLFVVSIGLHGPEAAYSQNGTRASPVPQSTASQATPDFCADEAVTTTSLDVQLLGELYCTEISGVQTWMRAADESAYPVFYGAIPVTWGAALLRNDSDYTDAYELTLSQVATYGIIVGLKEAFRRPRPYVNRPGLDARDLRLGPAERKRSLPSGHAAISATIATSLSLSHPRWYVIAPASAWASSVVLSRVWLGVHYPSDILTGTLIGTAVGVGVHLLGPYITPDFLESEDDAPGPMVQLKFRF